MKIEEYLLKAEFKQLKKKIDLYDLVRASYRSDCTKDYYFNEVHFNDFMKEYVREKFPKYRQFFVFRIFKEDEENKVFKTITLLHNNLEYTSGDYFGKIESATFLNVKTAEKLLLRWIEVAGVEYDKISLTGITEMFETGFGND